jgi:hypothetical protein
VAHVTRLAPTASARRGRQALHPGTGVLPGSARRLGVLNLCRGGCVNRLNFDRPLRQRPRQLSATLSRLSVDRLAESRNAGAAVIRSGEVFAEQMSSRIGSAPVSVQIASKADQIIDAAQILEGFSSRRGPFHREVRGLAAPPQRGKKLLWEWRSAAPTACLRIPSWFHRERSQPNRSRAEGDIFAENSLCEGLKPR